MRFYLRLCYCYSSLLYGAYFIIWTLLWNIQNIYQKQPFRGVLREKCSGNMQQFYKRTPMPKCDFNKVALQMALHHECSTVTLLHPWSIALVSLLLTLKKFCILFRCFYCLVWTCKCPLGKRQYQIYKDHFLTLLIVRIL